MDKHDRSLLKNVSLKNPWHFLALGFGSGLLPKAPGTYGSLAATPFCYALMHLDYKLALLVIVLTYIVGTYATFVTEKALKMHDNSAIVIDEFVGMFISVLFFPPKLYLVAMAFVLFRIFDVIKPFPIGFLDKRIAGANGVMIDDVLAGIFALACGHLIVYFFI